ncbi:hypothetical protein UFOVP236_55 [uncultured Caudovirales phage]|uniref:Uncharacterized protein n=1 Tax=uncultured Caudovirales phage TaxID=2100421 RepID=A0A6J7WUS0_9CAUD|nr:hypothetical protein UFOVP236_55 [uncultured Caudovirales phage]
MSKIIPITCILGMYSLALLSIIGCFMQAPEGTFWYMPVDTAVIVSLGAVGIHILVYLDDSFGLRK